MTAARLVVLSVLSALAAGPAFAQGRSDSAPGQNKDKAKIVDPKAKTRAAGSGLASPATAAASTSVPAASANAVVYYGSWLDDASIVEPGDIWIGLATGFWRGESNRQIDAPVASAAVGLGRRLQAGGSLSFYHFRDADGISENGFGNMSIYGKVQILDPYRAPHAIGVAVTPLVEMSPGSEDAFGWALPINIEGHRGSLRIYSSAGYFSRGSVFGTVGADVPIGSRLSISGTFGQSYARAGTHQTSLGVGASLGLTATSGAYVGLGRTFMPTEVGPGGVSLAGGMSFLLPDPKTP
ncbi:MAG: hypothetical protein EHM55_08255 [Acidobacteria bacterium]|nr:MAG: hypothetical protein EHM55_08255 [Acidobacteriota bacterium]